MYLFMSHSYSPSVLAKYQSKGKAKRTGPTQSKVAPGGREKSPTDATTSKGAKPKTAPPPTTKTTKSSNGEGGGSKTRSKKDVNSNMPTEKPTKSVTKNKKRASLAGPSHSTRSHDTNPHLRPGEFLIKQILEERTRNGKIEYFVEWEGYSDSENSWVPAETTRDMSDSEEEYEVEKILDIRKTKNKKEYLVQWTGYAAKFNKWVKEHDMHCPDLIKEFEMSKKSK